MAMVASLPRPRSHLNHYLASPRARGSRTLSMFFNQSGMANGPPMATPESWSSILKASPASSIDQKSPLAYQAILSSLCIGNDGRLTVSLVCRQLFRFFGVSTAQRPVHRSSSPSPSPGVGNGHRPSEAVERVRKLIASRHSKDALRTCTSVRVGRVRNPPGRSVSCPHRRSHPIADDCGGQVPPCDRPRAVSKDGSPAGGDQTGSVRSRWLAGRACGTAAEPSAHRRGAPADP